MFVFFELRISLKSKVLKLKVIHDSETKWKTTYNPQPTTLNHKLLNHKLLNYEI